MIYSDRDIIESEIKIEPFSMDNLQPSSYDVTLGNEFLIPEYYGPEIDAKLIYNKTITDEIYIKNKEFMLATTVETIHLPDYISGFVEGRSSIGRRGLFIQNAGWIDSGFKGQITLELYNATDKPILLVAGKRIAQIVFCEQKSRSVMPYQGKYQGQSGVVGSRMYQERGRTNEKYTRRFK